MVEVAQKEKEAAATKEIGSWVICGQARLSASLQKVVFYVHAHKAPTWFLIDVEELFELIAGHTNKADLHTKIGGGEGQRR